MSFLQSPNYIYKSMQVGGLIDSWCQRDWIGKFSSMEELGFQWDPMDCRLKQLAAFPVLGYKTPWCHAMSTPEKHCALDHNIIFNHFGIIHPRCQECWKVCVTLESFEDALKCEQLQLKMGYSAKTGMEMRDYTPKFWGAYWYNNSLDEGREKYLEVKEALKKHVSDFAAEHCILKRACTEFEMVKGPSPFWHNTDQELQTIEQIETFVDVRRSESDQPSMLKNHVHLKWVLWAHMNNDMSYVKYNGGKKLFPGYVTYHEGDIDDIKHDIALARAESKGINTDTADKFLALADQFADEHDITLAGDLVHVLGIGTTQPLKYRRSPSLLQEVPEAVKGDHDELT